MEELHTLLVYEIESLSYQFVNLTPELIKLKAGVLLLDECCHDEESIDFLKNQDWFTDVAGEDVELWSSNVEDALHMVELAPTVALDGVASEFVKHKVVYGLRGLASIPSRATLTLIGMKLTKSIKRINDSELDLTKRKSRALPSKRDTVIMIDTLEEFASLFTDYRKDPVNLDLDQITIMYRRLGIEIKRVGRGIEGWRVIGSATITSIVIFSAFSSIAAFLGIFGRIASAIAFKGHLTAAIVRGFGFLGVVYGKRAPALIGTPIRMRGWTSNDDIASEANRLFNVIDDFHDISHAISDMQHVQTKDIDSIKAFMNAQKTSMLIRQTDVIARRMSRRLSYAFMGIVPFRKPSSKK